MSMVSRYQKRIPGPLLDRVDIHIEGPRVECQQLAEAGQPARRPTPVIHPARNKRDHPFLWLTPQTRRKQATGDRLLIRTAASQIEEVFPISGGLGAMASRGHAAGESSEGRGKLAQSSHVVFAGRGMIRSTGFQPCATHGPASS